jgi:hypothetical protein
MADATGFVRRSCREALVGRITAEAPVGVGVFRNEPRDFTDECIYLADGGPLNRIDLAGPTITTNLAGTPSSRVIVVHNERLWGCGCGLAPDSIFYSSLNDGDTLGVGGSGGGEIIVRTFADEKVVSLASIGTSLLIFHRRGISRLTGFGQDDITVAPEGVTADVGTIAANSIAAFDNIAYFVSERGLYRCNEGEVAPVGTQEKPDPLLPILRQMTSAQLGAIRTVLNRATRELWVYLPGYGVFVYHTLLNALDGPWTDAYLTPETTALIDANDADGLPIVLRGDSAGWVSVCDSETSALDNIAANGTGGTAYDMIVQFHRQYCGDDAEAKALRWGYLTAQLNGSTDCTVSWNTGVSYGEFAFPPDNTGTWGGTTWGVSPWGSIGSQNYRVPMSGTGYYVDVSITDSGAALPVFSRWQLEAFALGRR